ncbi:MAG: hypothetical protein ACYDEF_01085 [Methanosarcina sp.]
MKVDIFVQLNKTLKVDFFVQIKQNKVEVGYYPTVKFKIVPQPKNGFSWIYAFFIL